MEAVVLRGDQSGVGFGANSLFVMLGPGHEPVAATLTDRFGDEVEITVGGIPYCGRPGVSPPCPTLAGSDDLPPGLHLSLQLDKSTIGPSESLSGVRPRPLLNISHPKSP